MSGRPYISVVSGLPRSGTSLVMQMAVAGGLTPLSDGVRRPDEDNPRGYLELESVKRTRDDSSWVAQAIGKVVKVVHLLLPELPLEFHYRVVLVNRDLDEVIRSQDKMLARLGKSAGSLPQERLKAVFIRQLEAVKSHLARHGDRFHLLEVDYNALIGAPLGMATRIAEFLDGLEVAPMLEAVDPALYRNRGTAG
jgi:hypothetical protein